MSMSVVLKVNLKKKKKKDKTGLTGINRYPEGNLNVFVKIKKKSPLTKINECRLTTPKLYI